MQAHSKRNKHEQSKNKNVHSRSKQQQQKPSKGNKWSSNSNSSGGGGDSFTELTQQLTAYGLKLRTIPRDGNCLFRSISDQLHGSDVHHQVYRKMAIDEIKQNSAEYAPFIDDDSSNGFDNYLANMSKDATWGGHIEIVALARALKAYIYVHQLNHPVFCVQFDTSKTKAQHYLHIAYLDEEHYSSIRNISENSAANDKPSFIQLRDPKSSDTADTAAPNWRETMIMKSSNCSNLDTIRQLLRDTNNDMDAVLEILNAENDQDGADSSIKANESITPIALDRNSTAASSSVPNSTTATTTPQTQPSLLTKRAEIKNAKQRRKLEKEKKELVRQERHKEKLQQKLAERKVEPKHSNSSKDEVEALEMLII